jgi:lipid-A-disaccharide synthase-like uncharacterized protein
VHAESLLVPATVAAGWLGQACFFSRFFLQWLASERARSSIVPRSFWWLSLGGAVLMSAYSLSRGTTLLLFGFLVSGAIAARNLRLAGRSARLDARWTALVVVLIVAASLWIELGVQHASSPDPDPWLMTGMLGQALWVSRFPVQWWLSERAGRSHFPPVFWRLSLVGNLLLLAYALHLRDPVFVLGFLPGPLLQARNLSLARQNSVPA